MKHVEFGSSHAIYSAPQEARRDEVAHNIDHETYSPKHQHKTWHKDKKHSNEPLHLHTTTYLAIQTRSNRESKGARIESVWTRREHQ
jgi:hypothetical protein